MKTYHAAPGDTMRISAVDVEHATDGAITSGLTGTVTVTDRYTGDAVSGPFPISDNVGNDWYADITAPDTVGTYRVEIAITAIGADRTLELELRVD